MRFMCKLCYVRCLKASININHIFIRLLTKKCDIPTRKNSSTYIQLLPSKYSNSYLKDNIILHLFEKVNDQYNFSID